MSTVNFNDTTPSAPTNYTNLKWQSDASGNISAYDPVGSWTTYTPTFNSYPNNTMTFGTPTITYAEYMRLGPAVVFTVTVSVTLGGTMESQVRIALPVATVTNNDVRKVAADAFPAVTGTTAPLRAYAQGGWLWLIPPNNANWAAGTYNLSASGTYRVA